jgi:hypothetical protein
MSLKTGFELAKAFTFGFLITYTIVIIVKLLF